MYFGYVYKITNLINNKIYVGQHTNAWVRRHQKLDPKYWGSGTYLRNAIEHDGKENFSIEILEWCKSEKELTEKELYWINELKALSEYGNYNLIDKPYPARDTNCNRHTFAEYNKTRDYSILSEHNRGSKMMTNGSDQMWVYQEDINKMLEQGWWFGSCKKRNRIYGPSWNKGKHGVQKNCKSVPGYVRITNGQRNTTVKPEELQSWLDKGYWKGITRHK